MRKYQSKIGEWFYSYARFIVKFRWYVLSAFIVITIIAASGTALIKTDSSIDGWFLENDPIKVSTREFEAIFGNNDFVGILYESEDVFSNESIMMLRDLGEELLNNVPYADKVTSLANMEFSQVDEYGDITIENLYPDEMPITEKELAIKKELAYAKNNLVNKLFTDDAKKTWIMLKLLPFPKDWEEKNMKEPNSAVGEKVYEIINSEKYKNFKLLTTGMPVLSSEEMRYFETTLGYIFLLALLTAIILLIVILRSAAGIFIPIITTLSSIILVFGGMGFLGVKLNSMLATVPILLGLSVSVGYSIHIFNFFKRELILTGDRKESVYYAVKETAWALLFTALTTIGSLLSFYFIDLAPLRWLGITSAAVIFTVYLIVISITPVLLSFGKNKIPAKHNTEGDKIKTDKYFIGFGKWVLKYSIPIVVVFILVMGIFIYGLLKMTINVTIEGSYGLKVPYVARMDYISKTKIGAWGAYDVTLKFDEKDKIKEPEVLRRFEDFEKKVKEFNTTKKTSSILDILKDMNRMLNEDKVEYYKIPDTKELAAQLLLMYEISGGTEANEWVDNDYTMLRLMVEITGMDANELEANIVYLNKLQKEIFPDAEIQISGSLPQFAALNKYVSIGQIKSFLIALTVIMLLMMIVFKSFKTGLIGMVPNITPAIVVGGLLGLTGIPLDFFTVTLIPMILGLAVDDTIHFISHARVEYEKHGHYSEAILITFKTVGKALFMTSFIIVSMFSLFMTSPAKMLFNLGVFVAAGISSALIADYLITPILLEWTKPFGKKMKKEV